MIPSCSARFIRESIVVVESELDGLLLHQETGDLTSMLALGSAHNRPDEKTHRIFEQAAKILVALDADRAGTKEAFWWKKHYPKAKWWPVPEGKDPTEAMQAGLYFCVGISLSCSSNSSMAINSREVTLDIAYSGESGHSFQFIPDTKTGQNDAGKRCAFAACIFRKRLVLRRSQDAFLFPSQTSLLSRFLQAVKASSATL